MIRICSFLFLLIGINALCLGAKISYALKMPRPQNHYFQVEMQVEQLKQKNGIGEVARLGSWFLFSAGIFAPFKPSESLFVARRCTSGNQENKKRMGNRPERTNSIYC